MISRDIYLNKLKKHKDNELIKVITGIRRCGKSTLLKLYKEYLIENDISKETIIFINFELMEFDYINDYKTLYSLIKSQIKTNDKYYIFLDEVQKVQNWEKAVNSLNIDSNVDIYITGSNAYLLSSELSTLLSGRYVEIKMHARDLRQRLRHGILPRLLTQLEVAEVLARKGDLHLIYAALRADEALVLEQPEQWRLGARDQLHGALPDLLLVLRGGLGFCLRLGFGGGVLLGGRGFRGLGGGGQTAAVNRGRQRRQLSFQRADALQQRRRVLALRLLTGLQRRDLQPHAGRRGVAQPALGAHVAVEYPQQLRLRKFRALLAIAPLVLVGYVQQRRRALGHSLHGQQRAQVLRSLAQEHLRLASGAHQLVDAAQYALGISGGKAVGKAEQKRLVAYAEHVAHGRGGQLAVRRGGHAHVEDAERVAHRALGGARDDLQRLGLGGDFQLGERQLHALDHQPGRDVSEIVALHAAEDRRGQLLRLGRREDEHDVCGRLFQRFEQCVERRDGEHVHLVDDVDLVLADLRGIAHLLQQVAHVFDAVVACRVQLQHVQRGFGEDGLARLALAAGVAVVRMLAVDRAAHDLRERGLARAAAAAKQVRVGDSPRFDLVAQGLDDRFLPDYLREGHGSPLPVKRLISHVCLRLWFVLIVQQNAVFYKSKTRTGCRLTHPAGRRAPSAHSSAAR